MDLARPSRRGKAKDVQKPKELRQYYGELAATQTFVSWDTTLLVPLVQTVMSLDNGVHTQTMGKVMLWGSIEEN